MSATATSMNMKTKPKTAWVMATVQATNITQTETKNDKRYDNSSNNSNDKGTGKLHKSKKNEIKKRKL